MSEILYSSCYFAHVQHACHKLMFSEVSSTFPAVSCSLLYFCKCTIYLIRIELQSSDSRCEARPIDITPIDNLIVNAAHMMCFFKKKTAITCFIFVPNAVTRLSLMENALQCFVQFKMWCFFVNSREQISLCSFAKLLHVQLLFLNLHKSDLQGLHIVCVIFLSKFVLL